MANDDALVGHHPRDALDDALGMANDDALLAARTAGMALLALTGGESEPSPAKKQRTVASLLRDSPDHALAKVLKRAVRAKHEANKEHLSTVADLNRQLERIKNIAKEYESSKEVASVISTQLERSNVNAKQANEAVERAKKSIEDSISRHAAAAKQAAEAEAERVKARNSQLG